jgi:hypothetical protein
VARRLGAGLVDEELDLLDLALDFQGFLRQACGKVRNRGDAGCGRVGRRLGWGCRLGAGLRGDVNPPAS